MGSTSYSLLGSTTLGGASATISLSGLRKCRFLIIELYTLETLTLTVDLTFNADSGANYSKRTNNDGGADVTAVSATSIILDATSLTPSFFRIFVVNDLTNEKLCIIHHIDQNTAGSANVPNRDEIVGKWANTTSQITEVDITSSTSTFAAGTILTVWGSDFVNVSDSPSFTDTVSKLIGKAVSDIDSFVESVSKLIGKAATDTITEIDTITKAIGKGLIDNENIPESLSKLLTKPTSDLVSLTELTTKLIGKGLSDTDSVVESVSKLITKNILDTVSATDSAGKQFLKNATELVQVSENMTKSVTKLIKDNLTNNDIITKGITKAIQDIIMTNDTLNTTSFRHLKQSISDIISFIESAKAIKGVVVRNRTHIG